MKAFLDIKITGKWSKKVSKNQKITWDIRRLKTKCWKRHDRKIRQLCTCCI